MDATRVGFDGNGDALTGGRLWQTAEKNRHDRQNPRTNG
jgi:hypothetical protein